MFKYSFTDSSTAFMTLTNFMGQTENRWNSLTNMFVQTVNLNCMILNHEYPWEYKIVITRITLNLLPSLLLNTWKFKYGTISEGTISFFNFALKKFPYNYVVLRLEQVNFFVHHLIFANTFLPNAFSGIHLFGDTTTILSTSVVLWLNPSFCTETNNCLNQGLPNVFDNRQQKIL